MSIASTTLARSPRIEAARRIDPLSAFGFQRRTPLLFMPAKVLTATPTAQRGENIIGHGPKCTPEYISPNPAPAPRTQMH